MKSEIKTWDDLKNKPFKILIPNLEQAIHILKSIGFKITKSKMGYWINI